MAGVAEEFGARGRFAHLTDAPRPCRPTPPAGEVGAVGRTVVSLGRAATTARRRARSANRRSTSTETTTNHSNSSTRPPRPASGSPANRRAPDPASFVVNWVAHENAGRAGASEPPTDSCQSPPGAIAAYRVPERTGPK